MNASEKTITVKVPTDRIAAPSPWRAFARMVGTLWSNGKARLGLIILGLFVLVAVFAPLLAPYGAKDNSFERNADASPAHWLGTTAAGEDVLSQLIYGSQVSLLVGLAAGILSTVVAVLIGPHPQWNMPPGALPVPPCVASLG